MPAYLIYLVCFLIVKKIFRQVSFTSTLRVSVSEVPLVYCLDELVADMVVDPDAGNTKSKYTQRVLVIVGRRAVVICEKEKRNKSLVKHDLSLRSYDRKTTLFSSE